MTTVCGPADGFHTGMTPDPNLQTLARPLVGRAHEADVLDGLLAAAVVVGLGFTAFCLLAEGRFAAAEGTIAEARTLADAMGNQTYLDGLANANLEVLSCRGDQAGARPLAARLLQAAARLLQAVADQGYGLGMQRVHYATSRLISRHSSPVAPPHIPNARPCEG